METHDVRDKSRRIARQEVQRRRPADDAPRQQRQRELHQPGPQCQLWRDDDGSDGDRWQEDDVVRLEPDRHGQEEAGERGQSPRWRWPRGRFDEGEQAEQRERRGDEVVRDRHPGRIEQCRIGDQQGDENGRHHVAARMAAADLHEGTDRHQPRNEDHQPPDQDIMFTADHGKDTGQENRQVRQVTESKVGIQPIERKEDRGRKVELFVMLQRIRHDTGEQRDQSDRHGKPDQAGAPSPMCRFPLAAVARYDLCCVRVDLHRPIPSLLSGRIGRSAP